MTAVVPILRIFDYDKAIEFYITWLEFKIQPSRPRNPILGYQRARGLR